MHISEGILSAPVLAAGAGIGAAGLAVGLRKTKEEDIPRVALLTSAFFVASLIHVPIGPASVHLILNGINGLILGWSAVPSIFVALTLQAVLFNYGGLTTLGVNTVVMAGPAVICRFLFYRLTVKGSPAVSSAAAFLCGAAAVFLSGILMASALVFTEESFLGTAKVVLGAHVPVGAIEGMITMVCASFLKKVKPEIFGVGSA